MAVYATGAKSLAICDRCGLRIPYQQLTTEWNGLRVCPECWDPKHPQLTPRTVVDAQAIYQPRSGTNSREDAQARILSGVISVVSFGTTEIEISKSQSGIAITSAIGVVGLTAETQVTGVSSSTAVGASLPTPPVSGLSSTTAVGTVAVVILGWGNEGWGGGGFGE